MFKFLPDALVSWKHVWGGALVTSLLFGLGKMLISIYLGRSTIASAYGAAGSLVVLLLWVYYSSTILFFGAELTQVYATRMGDHIEPEPHARRAYRKRYWRERHPGASGGRQL
jgi:membrane protein